MSFRIFARSLLTFVALGAAARSVAQTGVIRSLPIKYCLQAEGAGFLCKRPSSDKASYCVPRKGSNDWVCLVWDTPAIPKECKTWTDGVFDYARSGGGSKRIKPSSEPGLGFVCFDPRATIFFDWSGTTF
jgi:hypothetical protein